MNSLFWDLHSGLLHEAPGSEADTLRALALTGLSGQLSILDAGSGPGAASVTLLKALPEAQVTAIDLHAPFLDAAKARAVRAGCGDRLTVRCGDMATPPLAEGSLDLIWSEGAVYNLGMVAVLRGWAKYLRSGGRIAVSELVWTTSDPHPDVRAFWDAGYPGMTDRAGVLSQIKSTGMRLIGDFALPEDAWRNYYDPLAVRADALSVDHGEDHPVLVDARAEIAMRRDHGDAFDYHFFVVAS